MLCYAMLFDTYLERRCRVDAILLEREQPFGRQHLQECGGAQLVSICASVHPSHQHMREQPFGRGCSAHPNPTPNLNPNPNPNPNPSHEHMRECIGAQLLSTSLVAGSKAARVQRRSCLALA